MDLVTLKKRLSTYVSDKGRLKNVSEEVLFEILCSWEQWPGTAKEFYRTIGFSQRQMAKLLGKAKKLKREGHFGDESFKEIKLESPVGSFGETPCSGVEVLWKDGNILRFSQVDLLVDFLRKAA